MAAFSEIANTPLEVQLGGKTFKVRRVSLDTIFGKSEAAVLSLQRKRINEMAAEMEGEDKTSFLAKAMIESMPYGERLNQMTLSFLRSPDGVRLVLVDALKKDHPDIEEEINIMELITEESDTVRHIMDFVTGRSGKKAAVPFVAEEKQSL